MPAVSKKQRIAAAIAEHEPDKLNASNKGMLKMSHKQLHDYASTPSKGLPESADDEDGDEQAQPAKKRSFKFPTSKRY